MFNNFEKLKLGGELKAQCSLLSAIKRSRQSRGAPGVHDLLGLGAGGRRSFPQSCSHTCSSSLQSWWPSPPEACTSWWSPEGWLMDETFISIRGDALPGPLCSEDQKSHHLLWGVPGDADHHSVSSHPRHENPLLAGSIYTKQMLRFKYVLKPFWAGPRLGFRDVLESFWQCWFQLGQRGDVESCIAAATLEFWNVLIKKFCYQPFPSYAGQNPPGYKNVWNDSYVLMLSWIWINFNTFYNTCIPAKTKPMTSAWFEHTLTPSIEEVPEQARVQEVISHAPLLRAGAPWGRYLFSSNGSFTNSLRQFVLLLQFPNWYKLFYEVCCNASLLNSSHYC